MLKKIQENRKTNFVLKNDNFYSCMVYIYLFKYNFIVTAIFMLW